MKMNYKHNSSFKNVGTWSILYMHVMNKEVKQDCILMQCTLHNKPDLFPIYKDQIYFQFTKP